LIAFPCRLESFAQDGINPQLAFDICRFFPASSSALINGIEVVGEIFQLLTRYAESGLVAANSSARSSPEILRA
jgi:hypothetical protein